MGRRRKRLNEKHINPYLLLRKSKKNVQGQVSGKHPVNPKQGALIRTLFLAVKKYLRAFCVNKSAYLNCPANHLVWRREGGKGARRWRRDGWTSSREAVSDRDEPL